MNFKAAKVDNHLTINPCSLFPVTCIFEGKLHIGLNHPDISLDPPFLSYYYCFNVGQIQI